MFAAGHAQGMGRRRPDFAGSGGAGTAGTSASAAAGPGEGSMWSGSLKRNAARENCLSLRSSKAGSVPDLPHARLSRILWRRARERLEY